jgi:hypothetical protein
MRIHFSLILVFVVPLVFGPAQGRVYNIYGVAGMDEKLFLEQWSPVFETYLNQEVGKLVSNTTFKLRTTQPDVLQSRVESGQADFLFVSEWQFFVCFTHTRKLQAIAWRTVFSAFSWTHAPRPLEFEATHNRVLGPATS